MIEALNLSRVSNAVASLGIMRRAYLEAKTYAMEREAFGQKLSHYPMVQETLTELAAKQEIEMNTVFEVITLMDKVMGKDTKTDASEQEQLLFRLYVAVMKMETAEQAIEFSHEAIEMHGGNGYIEDFVTPRLLRDAQVLTVWGGTENILGLEVLRLIGKYQVEQIFVEEMGERLAVVREATPWVKMVESAINRLIGRIDAVRSLPEDVQTYYGKKIAKQITAIFESVVAIESYVNGNDRHQAIAEGLMEKGCISGRTCGIEAF